jgi:hypothetical protein
METIIRGGLLDTLDFTPLQRLGDNFEPYSSVRLRQLFYYKLRFGARNEVFLTAIQESVAVYYANAQTSTLQDKETLLQHLLNAASIRRLKNEP